METTIEYKGYTIDVTVEFLEIDPREYDNLATLMLFHKRYAVANETDFQMIDFGSWGEAKAAIIKKYKPVWIAPVYGYSHSGLDMGLQIQPYWYQYSWDGGCLGFAFVTRERVLEVTGEKRITAAVRNRIATLVANELSEYVKYINGVPSFGYEITDADGEVLDTLSEPCNAPDTAEIVAKRTIDKWTSTPTGTPE